MSALAKAAPRDATAKGPLTRAEMTHRIGRFYTGQPSWRTRLRALRRRLGDGRLALSEEEKMIEAKRYLEARRRAEGKTAAPVWALRLFRPLPPVLLAHDGTTTFRYVKALKNASTTILNLLLEITGEAAHRSWNAETHFLKSGQPHLVQLSTGEVVPVAINEHNLRPHRYLPAAAFAPEPYADIRFCVVRDPVERFLSSLTQIQIMSLRQGIALVPLTPADVDAWLDRMARFYAQGEAGCSAEDAYEAATMKERHLLRQTDALGKDAAYYTHIFSTRRPDEFHALLSKLAGKPLSPGDANSLASRQKILRAHGAALTRPQLSAAQRRRVEALYAEDYRVFGRWF